MEPRKNSKTHSPKSGTAKRNSPAKPAGDKKATVSKSEKKDAGAHPFDKFMKKTNPKTAYKNERKQDRLTEEKNKKEFFNAKESSFKKDRPYAKKILQYLNTDQHLRLLIILKQKLLQNAHLKREKN